MGKFIHYQARNEITNPFSNFNGYTVEVLGWINYFMPLFTGHLITCPFLSVKSCRYRHCMHRPWCDISNYSYINLLQICLEIPCAYLDSWFPGQDIVIFSSRWIFNGNCYNRPSVVCFEDFHRTDFNCMFKRQLKIESWWRHQMEKKIRVTDPLSL